MFFFAASRPHQSSPDRRRSGWTALAAVALLLAVAAVGCTSDSKNRGGIPDAGNRPGEGSGQSAGTPSASDPWRPSAHLTPSKNWMNDPNGLVYEDGTYHAFYQYNPKGNDWGNMSWGHSTSTDLVHWVEAPVAMEATETEEIFSGSIVVDTGNTSGLGSKDQPAMVALYTSAYKDNAPLPKGSQAHPPRTALTTAAPGRNTRAIPSWTKDLLHWDFLSDFSGVGA